MSDNTAYTPHLPDAVRRASERADELSRQAALEAAGEEGNQPEVIPGVTDQPSQQPQRDGAPPFELTPPDPEPREDRGPAPGPQQHPSSADWEQRYQTLQGKYNTELPELRGQVRSLQEMISNMQVQRQPAPEQTFTPAARPPSNLPPIEIPQEDIENYGQDLVSATQRWTEAVMTPRLAELERRLLTVEGGNHQLATYTSGQRVEQHLDREVPDWNAINHDQRFISWLHQTDPFSGQTRKKLIDEAYGTGDAFRTAAFFKAYKAEHTAVSQSPGTQTYQTGNTPAERLPLAELAVPGRGQSVTSPTPGAPERRIWTGPDVNAFYRQKQRGMFIGREADAARIEQDIINAPLEGRYRQ